MSSIVTLANPQRSLHAFAASSTRSTVLGPAALDPAPPTMAETIRRIRLTVKAHCGDGVGARDRRPLCVLDGGRAREQGPPEQIVTDRVHTETREFLAHVIASGRLCARADRPD
jgi:hypothetical protein